jgi:hypothetical protein
MRLIVIASLLLASTNAFAAPVPTSADADAAARRAAPAKSDVKAIYDFENDSVSGDALKPDHEVARTRVATKRESMIQLRLHFIPQMLHMAQDI